MTIIKKDKSYFYALLFLLIISFFLTIDNFSLQSAVDGALILGEKVKYPDQFTNVTAVHFNSWTLLNHLSLIFVKMNINVFIISKLLLYTSTIFFSFGIFLISINLTKSLFLSLFLVCFTLIGKINFGNADFPALLYFRGTYGMFALSTFTIFVGLLFNKNFKLAGFFLILLFSIHLVVGLWVIFLFFITISYLKITDDKKKSFDRNFTKNFSKGIIVALIPTLLSFLEYKKNTMGKNSYSQESFNTYLNLWDHHRNITEINYIYIALTIILVILYFLTFKKDSQKDIYKKFLFLFICLHCIGSLVIYLSFKLFPNYFPEIFVRAMGPRVFLIHTHIGYPLIISFLYILLNYRLDFIYNTKRLFVLISILIIFGSVVSIYKYKNRTYKSNRDLKSKIYYRIDRIKKNFSNSLNSDEIKFWKSVENINTSGYFVTTYSSSEPTLKFGRKPYIINANYFDLIPYHPYTVDETKIILENIYELNFTKPPLKYTPEIRDHWIIKTFEKRSYKEWLFLSKKYNLSGVIVPSNWRLNINKKINSDKYILYKLQ